MMNVYDRRMGIDLINSIKKNVCESSQREFTITKESVIIMIFRENQMDEQKTGMEKGTENRDVPTCHMKRKKKIMVKL